MMATSGLSQLELAFDQIPGRAKRGEEVLAGIEDPKEWKRFLEGLLELWTRVGQHEL